MSILEEINRDELEQEMYEIWAFLGQSKRKIYLKDKTDEKLKEDLRKLRCLKMALQVIHDKGGGTQIAVQLLAEAFGDKPKKDEERTDEKGLKGVS